MPPAKCDKAKNKIEIILDTKTVFMCYFIFNLNLRLAEGEPQYGKYCFGKFKILIVG